MRIPVFFLLVSCVLSSSHECIRISCAWLFSRQPQPRVCTSASIFLFSHRNSTNIFACLPHVSSRLTNALSRHPVAAAILLCWSVGISGKHVPVGTVRRASGHCHVTCQAPVPLDHSHFRLNHAGLFDLQSVFRAR